MFLGEPQLHTPPPPKLVQDSGRQVLYTHAMFSNVYIYKTKSSDISDHAHFKPPLYRRSTIGAERHLLRAGAARALMGTRHGEVRLRAFHAHDARGLAANGGLGNLVAAGDVTDIGER